MLLGVALDEGAGIEVVGRHALASLLDNVLRDRATGEGYGFERCVV